jgi:hypothetical protein
MKSHLILEAHFLERGAGISCTVGYLHLVYSDDCGFDSVIRFQLLKLLNLVKLLHVGDFVEYFIQWDLSLYYTCYLFWIMP